MNTYGNVDPSNRNTESGTDRGFVTRSLITILALMMALMLTLTACGNSGSTGDTGAVTTTSAEYDSSVISELFTDRDLSGDYDESEAETITLSGSGADTSAQTGVSIDGSTVTISAEGTYIVSGTLSDGQIVVDADEAAKVQIVLKDASVTSSTSAALYVKSADKVFVTTAEGTENTLANGGSFTADGDTNVDGAVFAKDDICFNGSGSLTVTSPAGHGIVGKDDVKIAGGTVTIDAERHGVQANDSIRVAEASISIKAGKEGLEALLVYICSGDISIEASDDGINAAGDSQEMDGGTDGSIEISGGKIYITAGGDGIDSNGSVTISGGYTVVSGPTQGDTSVIDFNSTGTITGGTFIGTGGAGMAQNFTDAEQGLIAVSVGNQSAGQKVTLKDADGNTLAEVTPELDYAVVYISTADMTKGSTYELTAGTYSESITLSDNIYSSITGGMQGGMGQGGMHQGSMPGGPGGEDSGEGFTEAMNEQFG